MERALRLAAAAALPLALSACVVDTDSLKPRSDAECIARDPGSKACGYKCVSARDPSIGCGNAGCQPCPSGGPGWETFCGPAAECLTRPPCPAGQVYCDGPTDLLCDDLGTSGTHCGACDHYCYGAACVGGTCASTSLGTVPGAQDISSDGTALFLLANDYGAPGTAAVLKDLAVPPFATWTGHATFLEADPYGFVAWDRTHGGGVWAAGTTGAPVGLLLTTSGTPVSAALDPAYVYLAETGGTATGETASDLVALERRAGGLKLSYTFAGSALWTVAAAKPDSPYTDVLAGTTTGDLRWVNWDGTSEGTYATGIDVPVRLVVYDGNVGPAAVPRSYAFWLGASGAFYRQALPAGPVETLVRPVAETSTYLDLYADAEGVYWIDATPNYTPFVAEWRAAHDDLVYLAVGDVVDPPARVAATVYGYPPGVFWLTASGALHAVPK